MAIFAGPVYAQSEFHHLTFNVGGGYTATTGRGSNYLDDGGNFQAGAGFNFDRYFGVVGTFSFNDLGLTGRALNAAGVPGGYAHTYSLTVDPKFTIPLTHRMQLYVLAGGGWMRRTVNFTQPTLVQTFIFDPWWGYVGPAVVPANQLLGSFPENAGVWDIGGGLNFPLPRTSAHLYVEARYYDALTPDTHTTLVPITLGLRW